MRRIGRWLMGLGFGVGMLVGAAILAHFGVAGASWLVNVALAKLGLVASLGLMAAGASSIRIANMRAERLSSGEQMTRVGADNRDRTEHDTV